MKKLSVALTIALAFPFIASATGADTSPDSISNINQLDNFYVAGNLGQAQYRTSYEISQHDSVFQNVRFGWRWNEIIGPEVGYAYLGRRKDEGQFGESSVNARAATIGINAKYDFYDRWFISTHGGHLRSQRTNNQIDYVTGYGARHTSWDNGWYAGLGLGYDVTKNVSAALNYDNYHLQYTDNTFHDKVNVAAYSASVEYRF